MPAWWQPLLWDASTDVVPSGGARPTSAPSATMEAQGMAYR
jgi:hypothetical protein